MLIADEWWSFTVDIIYKHPERACLLSETSGLRLVRWNTHGGLQVFGLPDQVVQPLPPLQHLADVVRQDDFDLVDLILHVVHLSRLAAGRLVRARGILREMTTPLCSTALSSSRLRRPDLRRHSPDNRKINDAELWARVTWQTSSPGY